MSRTLVRRTLAVAAILLLGAAGRVFATEYFVDFSAGSDANGGTSQATAWKHAPGDTAATGQPAAKALVARDIVAFRGGVSYHDSASNGIGLAIVTASVISFHASNGARRSTSVRRSVSLVTMRRSTRCLLAVPILLASPLLAAPAGAQMVLHPPPMPQEETLVYTARIGDDSWLVTQSIRLTSEAGKSWYEVQTASPEADVSMRLDPVTLFPWSSEVVSRSGDSVVRRTTEVLKAEPHPKANELVVGDFNALPITFRGLPWGTFSSVNLVFLGSTRVQSFALQLSVVRRETISAGGKPYDCWKVQIGLGGLFGTILGKSSYWFSADAPHYLVRSETPSGGPGSPSQTWELLSRQTVSR